MSGFVGRYEQIEDDGVLITPQRTINFTGSGVTVSDSGGKTQVSIPGGVSDGDKGDIVVSGSGAVWTIDAGVVTAAKTSITGTPDGSKYLRDDWTWQAVSGGSGLTHPQVMARGLGG